MAWGVEPAPAMLEAARAHNPGARVEQGVATALPLPDASVDALLQIEVLRYLHMNDIRGALAESRRVLKPGGRILVTLVNRWALDGFYARQRLRQQLKGADFDRTNPHCEFFTPTQARRELERAGFTDVRAVGRLFAPFRIAYKATPALASRLARRFETLDDRIHAWPWTTPFAGHLIVTAQRPRSG
jgi:SAM-dependent methyltransferase